MQPPEHRLAEKRAELDAVLASGCLGRSNYVVRLLTFVCEKYFEGRTEDVKEYSIAVQALGRSADFDPQADTIVRVTAHNLRKRLEEYYRTDGADHAIHIRIPAGHYVPDFVRNDTAGCESSGAVRADESATLSEKLTPAPHEAANGANDVNGVAPTGTVPAPRRVLGVIGSLAALVCVAAVAFYLWPRIGRASYGAAHADAAAPIGISPTLRAVIGTNRMAYTDHAGYLWSADDYCSGGDSFSVSQPNILGTSDPGLYEAGRSGSFGCKFPVPPGTYEMHLLFAETSGLQENARTITYTIDGGATNNLDVVDDSGADDTATTKIFTDVRPEPDGTIHLDFTNAHSFLNAVEILPDASPHALPIRILAGRDQAYRDEEGRLWLPDRYFFGGRESSHGSEVRGLPDSGIYDGQRLGHFHYSIPVAPGDDYTLKLHFIERWFGIQNQNVGGPGSRVYDVSCNGVMLLKNFDIMREAQNAPLVKTFSHVEPTPQDKIEIYFTPNVNYPSVSAIEVLPE